MNAPRAIAGPEDEIRALVAQWLDAVHARDIGRIAAHYAPDIRAFDAITRLAFDSLDAYAQHWKACFDSCPGEMIFELRDLAVVAGDDIAFAHGLNRCGGPGADGDIEPAWLRITFGFRRRNGRWQVVHEHVSAPFDVESGGALLDLMP